MTDYERLSIVAREIYKRAVKDHQIVWRGDEVYESFDETPLGKATKTFNEACLLLAQLSADANAMMLHGHHFSEADRCTVCGYKSISLRRPGA